jgi:hypothetical protein
VPSAARSQDLSRIRVAAVRVADHRVLAGDVREAAEVDDVGEAVGVAGVLEANSAVDPSPEFATNPDRAQ